MWSVFCAHCGQLAEGKIGAPFICPHCGGDLKDEPDYESMYFNINDGTTGFFEDLDKKDSAETPKG